MSNPRLSIIPAGAVTDRSLEPRDLQTLCLLGRHTDRAGWCARSQVRMAAEMGCGRASVQRSLERLYEAGWVEKKRRDEAGKVDETSRPSASYAYRVVLDRDDFAFENATRDIEGDGDDSYAESASEQGGCPPVGTPGEASSDAVPSGEKTSEGAHPDGHPGAHLERAPGAHTYVGTKNAPLERPLLERERDARAKDRKARFIAAFEQRWPTAAADDRQRTGYAAEALTQTEEAEALSGIGPFLENLKRLGRKNVPAGWNYLEQKRWTLLEQAKPDAVAPMQFAGSSREGRAIAALFDLAGKIEFFYKAVYRGGIVYHRTEITPQLLALADVQPRAEWDHVLTRQQAGAWNSFINERLGGLSHARLSEGSRAPWPWPPRKDGTLSPEASPSAAEEHVNQ